MNIKLAYRHQIMVWGRHKHNPYKLVISVPVNPPRPVNHLTADQRWEYFKATGKIGATQS